MKNRLPIVLSATALVVAVFGITPLGQATTNVAQTHFARNANFLRGKAPSVKAKPNTVVVRNGKGQIAGVPVARTPGISGHQIVVVTQNHTSRFNFTAACPAGKDVIGGGHDWSVGDTDVWFWQSSPLANATGWQLRGIVNRGGASSEITAFAICAFVT